MTKSRFSLTIFLIVLLITPLILTPKSASQTTKSEKMGYELFFDGKRVGHEPGWRFQRAVINLLMNRERYKNKKVEGRYNGKKIVISGTGYELFWDGVRVGHEPGWTYLQGEKNLQWNRKRYPKRDVVGWYNGNEILISKLGYELFFDGRRVGHEPGWSRHQAIKNFRKNKKRYPNKKVEGKYEGEPLTFLEQVEVLPVFFVPNDQKEPTNWQISLLQTHLSLTRARYKTMLKNRDTFKISSVGPIIYKSQNPLTYFEESNDRGAAKYTGELLEHLNLDRYNCPFIFLIIFMNAKRDFPAGGGTPFNGGINTGGGIVIMSSYNLNDCRHYSRHFQSTLQHELGHSFGLCHVNNYGYDMKTNASIMSYNRGHWWNGFTPPVTPGILIPEDLRALSGNKLVFPSFRFDPKKDIPRNYKISKRICYLGPMNMQTCCTCDSPACPCFVDSGAWNPNGRWIQDVALATLGTRESCVPNGGKPFYQMQLGFDSRRDANLDACNPQGLSRRISRQAWCSETISYWHHKVGIPYENGYKSNWLLDWQLPHTGAIETFYRVEDRPGGRGRWIEWNRLNYNDFKPGENAPVPGAYVLIRKFENGGWGTIGQSHSMMIDEMTVYRTSNRRVVRVEIKLLEGNSGNMVKNSSVIEDILSVTPAGKDYIGKEKNKVKLKGFGIDLDRNRRPIYDRSRLHFVEVPGDKFLPVLSAKAKVVPKVKVSPEDEKHAALLRELTDYAKKARQLKGAAVRSPDERFQAAGIPDGRKSRWVFPSVRDKVKPQKKEIEIDLHAVHPLPIKGIVLKWESKSLPNGYRVQWAGADHNYKGAVSPEVDPALLSAAHGAPLTIPIMFDKSGAGVKVRYVKFIFPRGTFPEGALLEQLRFIYDWGPDTDAPDNPVF